MEQLPPQMFDPDLTKKLRTLDLSKNKLTSLDRIEVLAALKTLQVSDNMLAPGSLRPLANLSKLQSLNAARNQLGADPTITFSPPKFPASLQQLSLAANAFSSVPAPILMAVRLEKLDLSSNQLATVPEEIANLVKLEELLLDSNMIVSLPPTIGQLKRLKVLSLRQNKIEVTSTVFTERNPQPIPEAIFTQTALIDLNLHGNRMTNTQLNEFAGFQHFLDRRQKVKSKTLTNLDVCGLK